MASRDTDRDWKIIAEREPYWGVLSEPQFKAAAISNEQLEEFYKSGEIFVGNLLGLIKAKIDPDFVCKRALDFGCGVGRLLLPMARHAAEVVGIDVAPEMLRLCAAQADLLGINNVSLLESDDDLSNVDGYFDLVNSYIVLQHIPPDRGYRILNGLVGKTAIGGIGSLQVTYGKSRKFLVHEQSKAKFYRREGNIIFDLSATNSDVPDGTINMYDYDLNNIFSIISEKGGAPMVVLPTSDDGHLGLHIIFKRAR